MYIHISYPARRAGSDDSLPASGSVDPGFDPRRGARKGGDVYFLIARLHITGRIKFQTLPQYVCLDDII